MSGGTQLLKHGSLFSGIGGFDLAAEWMGWANIFHCEFNPFCQRVLKHYFPKVINHEDIRTTDFTIYKGSIDILTGGFPCQPYSLAGKRLGKEDERHLWPSMLRAIREIRPRWVVAENVLGLVSWNGGVVFEEVQSDLETEGYQVQPFILPAAGVDAPHRRERIWFIAYAEGNGNRRKLQRLESKDGHQQRSEECRKNYNELRHDGEVESIANANRPGLQKKRAKQPPAGAEQSGELGKFTTNANNREQQEQSQCYSKGRQSPSAPWPLSGAGSGAGNITGNVAEGVRQLGTGAEFLQKAAPNPSGIRCNNGSDNREERQVQNDQRLPEKDQPKWEGRQCGTGTADPFPANPHFKGLEGETSQRVQTGPGRTNYIYDDEPAGYGGIERWENFPQTQPSICIGNDGLPGQLDFNAVFEGIPFPVKPITFSKWRTESIKALGNAIVPQVALQIFTAINEMIFNLNK
jgi:DNA (cytosine-5)-methyltransferase 1